MARYQLDDPRLQDALDEAADRDTADWPAPDADQRAQLARLLPAGPATAGRTTRKPTVARPKRNAA